MKRLFFALSGITSPLNCVGKYLEKLTELNLDVIAKEMAARKFMLEMLKNVYEKLLLNDQQFRQNQQQSPQFNEKSGNLVFKGGKYAHIQSNEIRLSRGLTIDINRMQYYKNIVEHCREAIAIYKDWVSSYETMPEEFKSILDDEIERCFKVIALATRHILLVFPINNIAEIRKIIDQTSALLMEDVNLWSVLV